MIKEFVSRFTEKKKDLEAVFSMEHPSSYMEVVKAVVQVISNGDYGTPDPNRIHEIDDGDYQGTLVYVIAETGYQPSTYWYVKVAYGSCSGCDTLQAICGYDNGAPSSAQVSDYMTLALHVVQGLKRMGDD